eukprot:Pgem_evm1s18068
METSLKNQNQNLSWSYFFVCDTKNKERCLRINQSFTSVSLKSFESLEKYALDHFAEADSSE